MRRSFGAVLVDKEVDEVCVDQENKLVTTPAFMYEGKFHQIQVRETRILWGFF